MSSPEYGSHAVRLHSAARTQHREWVKGLSTDQRENLRRLGVLDFADDTHEVGGHAPSQCGDMAESTLARVEVDFAGLADGLAGTLSDQFDLPLEKAEALLKWHAAEVAIALRTHDAELLSIVVGGLLASNNIRIAAAGLAFASQMDIANGLGSQATYARKIGVSRTILSKSVKAWKKQLKLRTTIWQKSEAACATYSENGKANHWRKTKATATALMEKIHTIRKSHNP